MPSKPSTLKVGRRTTSNSRKQAAPAPSGSSKKRSPSNASSKVNSTLSVEHDVVETHHFDDSEGGGSSGCAHSSDAAGPIDHSISSNEGNDNEEDTSGSVMNSPSPSPRPSEGSSSVESTFTSLNPDDDPERKKLLSTAFIRTSLTPTPKLPEDITDSMIIRYQTKNMTAPEKLSTNAKRDFIFRVTPASASEHFAHQFAADEKHVNNLYQRFYNRRKGNQWFRHNTDLVVEEYLKEVDPQLASTLTSLPTGVSERTYEIRLKAIRPPKIVCGLSWALTVDEVMKILPFGTTANSFAQERCMDFLRSRTPPSTHFSQLYDFVVWKQSCMSMSPDEFRDYLLQHCPIAPRLGSYARMSHGFGFSPDPERFYASLEYVTYGAFNVPLLQKLTPMVKGKLTTSKVDETPTLLESRSKTKKTVVWGVVPLYHHLMTLLRAATPEPIYQAMLSLTPTQSPDTILTFEEFDKYFRKVCAKKWCTPEDLWELFGIPSVEQHNLIGMGMRTFDPRVTVGADEPYVRNPLAMTIPDFVPNSSMLPLDRQYRPILANVKRRHEDGTSKPHRPNKRRRFTLPQKPPVPSSSKFNEDHPAPPPLIRKGLKSPKAPTQTLTSNLGLKNRRKELCLSCIDNCTHNSQVDEKTFQKAEFAEVAVPDPSKSLYSVMEAQVNETNKEYFLECLDKAIKAKEVLRVIGLKPTIPIRIAQPYSTDAMIQNDGTPDLNLMNHL
ncbi:hypothetical protein TRICI_001525 [Trichomonascus ciferrii]|uniref:Uncharacterized protein n=1 Tax=Trichomonascus ciferrii TaxID=44093 RepID=A0A642VAL2_9ASCO|nr:hypothetical protein TRICI_001525 [Trichomonascus ciferrii]